MAIDFDTASNERYDVSSSPITATPLSLSCLFRPDANNLADVLLSLGVDSAEWNVWYIEVKADSTVAAVTASSTTFAVSSTTDTYAANVWAHAGGAFASATSRIAYLDGVAATENTTSKIPFETPNHVSVAAPTIAEPTGNVFEGALAEVGIWNVALTDGEWASLGAKVSPLLIRPNALQIYYPMIKQQSTLFNRMGGHDASQVGTPTTVVHPRVIYPFAPPAIFVPAAGAIPTIHLTMPPYIPA